MNRIAPDYGQAPSYLGEIPRYVSYTSPVSTAHTRNERHGPSELPLNLVALIVSYLDDIADIARVTRTSRLLYYMTLPQLYQRVSLHSHRDIRYVNGRPEGFGSGSPLMMALNGLVTKPHASLVQEFRIWGQWKEIGLEDLAKGRVPDNSMMLNILLRAVVDKMSKLRAFSWELDSKPLKTLYQGLAAQNLLTSLTMKFPNARVPRPSVLIPPMHNLRALKVTDIDPLCYPDDISLLICGSKKLEDLRLHFSPRMRREVEPSVNLGAYFGRCAKANYKPKLKHCAMQNFFGLNMDAADYVFDPDTCKSVVFFDTFGGAGSSNPNSSAVFIDEAWKNWSPDMYTDFRQARSNEVSMHHVEMIRRARGLERLYIVSGQGSGTPQSTPTLSPTSTVPSEGTIGARPPIDEDMTRLGKEYLHVLTRYHGQSLRHILFHRDWAWGPEDFGTLVRYCPNLEQLGLAINTPNHAMLKLLLPFLPKLKAFRLLHNEHLAEAMRMMSHEDRMNEISANLPKFTSVSEQPRFIGFGDVVYKTGRDYMATMEDGSQELRRDLTIVSKEEVQDVEIWKMDTLDIDVDPVATFTP